MSPSIPDGQDGGPDAVSAYDSDLYPWPIRPRETLQQPTDVWRTESHDEITLPRFSFQGRRL